MDALGQFRVDPVKKAPIIRPSRLVSVAGNEADHVLFADLRGQNLLNGRINGTRSHAFSPQLGPRAQGPAQLPVDPPDGAYGEKRQQEDSPSETSPQFGGPMQGRLTPSVPPHALTPFRATRQPMPPGTKGFHRVPPNAAIEPQTDQSTRRMRMKRRFPS